mmetsp:Transcript_15044/g.35663  ORF Transcript_15044/g.35663 Transcript_15044/m.35663 type:complete len:248 (+) Transcript_15044:185-928(+)
MFSFARFALSAVALFSVLLAGTDAFVTTSMLPAVRTARAQAKGPIMPLMAGRGGGKGGRTSYGGGMGHEASTMKRAGRLGKMVMVELMQILRSPYMIKTPKDKMNVNLVSLVSIVDVEMSKDTKVAKIMISVVGSDKERREAVKWLTENTRAIRFALAQRMAHLKSVPELRFSEARLPQAMSVMSILEQIAKEREEKEAKQEQAREEGEEDAEEAERAVCEGMERELAAMGGEETHERASSPLSLSR